MANGSRRTATLYRKGDMCECHSTAFQVYAVAGACSKRASVQILDMRLCRFHAQAVALELALRSGKAKEIRASTTYVPAGAGKSLLEAAWTNTKGAKNGNEPRAEQKAR